MPRVNFPQVLQRHVACPPVDVTGGTVREALDAAFAIYPTLRGYLLDDGGALRQHITVFVDGEVVRDRARLSTAVRSTAVIDVLQALSGG
ncbi:MAG: MoaD/ThiS family protein [Planctomycetes bacterium]|nr:MoaD/ThiS family protein [Planctomycetota bacterium]